MCLCKTCLALCTTWLSPCFSFVPSFLLSATFIYPPPPGPLSSLCSLHFYDLQEFFTMWYLQSPLISLGLRWPPLEALALCSASPPLPRPKPNSRAHPPQRPLDRPLCPLLSPPLSTAAHRQSCTAPLPPRSLCPLLLPFTLSHLLLHPFYQTL